jgi:hypothetical protein
MVTEVSIDFKKKVNVDEDILKSILENDKEYDYELDLFDCDKYTGKKYAHINVSSDEDQSPEDIQYYIADMLCEHNIKGVVCAYDQHLEV